MVAVGFLLIWSGYSVSLWGWCLLRGYNVTMGQLLSPAHPYGSGAGQGWPPSHIPDTQVWPDGHGVTPAGILGAGVVSGATAQQIQNAAQNALNPSFYQSVPNATGPFPTVQPGGKVT